MQNSFQLDYPASSDSDCIGPQRAFSSSAAFATEEDEQHRRVGSLGHTLSQPATAPVSVSNGFRYSNQQSGLQDVSSFSASPGLLLSPLDSCSGASANSSISASSLPYSSLTNVFPNNVTSAETFLPTPSVYSQSAGYQWNERMSDFRSHRIPTLHPSSSVPTSLQTQGATIPSSSSMTGRGDNYLGAYSLSRTTYPSSLSTLEMPRYSPYAPRPFENPVDPSNTMYANPGSVLLEPSPRPSQTSVDAPPFLETDVLQTVVTSSQTIKPEIQAKIHKGFFQVDEKWTCYRRNYFSVSCSFSLRPWVPNAPLYLQLPNHTTEQIRSFSMSISAIVNAQDGEIRELVQHTPKRDKQSEKRPGKITLQPLQPLTLGLTHGTTGIPNHTGFGTQPHSAGMQADYAHPYASSLQPSHPPTTHTFERIQFQKATANNGKRRAQQQYYNLVVELYAEIPRSVGSSDAQWIKVARRISHPMVVRGRSPGHYKDGRRDSSASMGPDSGTGSSGDGSRGTVLPPGIIGQASLSHLPIVSYDSSRRGGSHYSRNGQRQLASADHSPLSTSPLISSSSSSTFEFTMFNDSMDPAEAVDDASHLSSYHDSAFGMAAPDRRKSPIHSNRRSPLSNVDFSTHEEGNEDSDGTFDDNFDSVIPIFPNDQDDSSQYLKRSPGPTGISSRQTTAGGYETGYPSRVSDNSYSRFDQLQTSRGLCT